MFVIVVFVVVSCVPSLCMYHIADSLVMQLSFSMVVFLSSCHHPIFPFSGGTVAEMLRGIRLYFHKLVSSLTAPAAAQAQLGLGHSYSRAKVKFNVHRSDNMIIQSISLLDQLDKDINTFSMRIR